MCSSLAVWILQFYFGGTLLQLLPTNFRLCIQEGAVLLHLRTLAAAETNPADYIPETLELSDPRSLMQYLAFQD
jgi:hypothetical protein